MSEALLVVLQLILLCTVTGRSLFPGLSILRMSSFEVWWLCFLSLYGCSSWNWHKRDLRSSRQNQPCDLEASGAAFFPSIHPLAIRRSHPHNLILLLIRITPLAWPRSFSRMQGEVSCCTRGTKINLAFQLSRKCVHPSCEYGVGSRLLIGVTTM